MRKKKPAIPVEDISAETGIKYSNIVQSLMLSVITGSFLLFGWVAAQYIESDARYKQNIINVIQRLDTSVDGVLRAIADQNKNTEVLKESVNNIDKRVTNLESENREWRRNP